MRALAAEHNVQGVGDESTPNSMYPWTAPKENTQKALDLAHSPATNVRHFVCLQHNLHKTYLLMEGKPIGINQVNSSEGLASPFSIRPI